MKIEFPTAEWVSSLKVGDPVLLCLTPRAGEDVQVRETIIKSISKTGIMRVEGSGFSFKDGYRRGYQYSGNCWLQPVLK